MQKLENVRDLIDVICTYCSFDLLSPSEVEAIVRLLGRDLRELFDRVYFGGDVGLSSGDHGWH